MADIYILNFPSDYKTPSVVGKTYNLLNVTHLINLTSVEVVVSVENTKGKSIYSSRDYGEVFSGIQFIIESGLNVIKYEYRGRGSNTSVFKTETFTIYGVTNRYPLKPWTNEEVINRVLQLAEPLREGETPRFSLDIESGEVSERQFQALAPEFTFTRMNLREVMQTIGGVLHAEPRLHLNDDYTGRWTYDKYGGNTLATFKNFSTGETKPLNTWRYTTNKQNQDIEQACTKLDSYQDNLVNRINWQDGTIEKPSEYLSHGVTLRSETLYIRLTEEDTGAYFSTEFPIDKIESFEVVYRIDGETKTSDITGYIFPSSVYENLSSYSGGYPSSKSYALYYEQGQKGIKGFFFKPPSGFGGTIGENYTIVNILKAANVPKSVYSNYNTIEFRITYVPIYSTRIQHGKSYLSDYLAAPRVINYAQGDNSVETRFFGENIKGAAQRLGTIEKYVSFNFKRFENIPKAGDLWDDDYYISTVNVAVFHDRFEITCGLSKHFNRKSKYIGANSQKRIYEVSETMVQERHTVISDYMVIEPTDKAMTRAEYEASGFGDSAYLRGNGFNNYWRVLKGTTLGEKVDEFTFKGYNKKGDPLKASTISLPCISSAFGNSVEFTAECADNFSAGAKVEKYDAGDISGYFTQGVEYSDYYGRIYYIAWSIGYGWIDDSETITETKTAQEALSYPEDVYKRDTYAVLASTGFDFSTYGHKYMQYRKDSREKLKFSYRIETVSGDESFIIGTGISLYNPLVTNIARKDGSGASVKPKIFILSKKIGKFDTLFDEDTIVSEYDMPTSQVGGFYLSLKGVTATKSGKAWAIAYPYYNGKTVKVENEDGEEEDYTPRYGGEILIGRNIPVSVGDTVGDFVAYAVHDLQAYITARRKAGKLEI